MYCLELVGAGGETSIFQCLGGCFVGWVSVNLIMLSVTEFCFTSFVCVFSLVFVFFSLFVRLWQLQKCNLWVHDEFWCVFSKAAYLYTCRPVTLVSNQECNVYCRWRYPPTMSLCPWSRPVPSHPRSTPSFWTHFRRRPSSAWRTTNQCWFLLTPLLAKLLWLCRF